MMLTTIPTTMFIVAQVILPELPQPLRLPAPPPMLRLPAPRPATPQACFIADLRERLERMPHCPALFRGHGNGDYHIRVLDSHSHRLVLKAGIERGGVALRASGGERFYAFRPRDPLQLRALVERVVAEVQASRIR